MTCAACGYDTKELYSGIDPHKRFRILSLCCKISSTKNVVLEVHSCPRCGTLRI